MYCKDRTRAAARDLAPGRRRKCLGGAATSLRLELPRWIEKHDLPLELAFELIHIRFALDTASTGCAETGPSVPADPGRLKPIKGAYCVLFNAR